MPQHNWSFPGVFILLAVLVSACTPSAENLASLITTTPTGTPSPTQQPTLTPTATPSATPTPEIIFHAGIPATMEECNVLHPGTSMYEAEMAELDDVDGRALAALGGEIRVEWKGARITYPDLPLPYKDYVFPSSSVLSCSIYQYAGERKLIISMATSPDTYMRIVFDEAAARNFVFNNGGAGMWDNEYSFEGFFSRMTNGESMYLRIGLFYDQFDAPFDRNGENGFEGVYDFFDSTVLQEPLTIVSSDESYNFLVTNIANLSFVSHRLGEYNLESQQRILEELQKIIWPAALLEQQPY
jgi:hypothetical protein